MCVELEQRDVYKEEEAEAEGRDVTIWQTGKKMSSRITSILLRLR